MTPLELYGDGLQDDTDALEFLFKGGAIRVASPRVTAQLDGGTVRLLNAKFRTRRPLRLPADLHLYSPNCTYIIGNNPPLPYPLIETCLRPV